MKSWYITSGKDATTLELRDVPVPEPRAGELIARVKAAGLNRGEFIAGHGVSGNAPKAAGIEAAEPDEPERVSSAKPRSRAD